MVWSGLVWNGRTTGFSNEGPFGFVGSDLILYLGGRKVWHLLLLLLFFSSSSYSRGGLVWSASFLALRCAGWEVSGPAFCVLIVSLAE